MAGRDNVLFEASITNGTAAGTVIPLSLLKGIENVRQGYGTPVLKNVRAYYRGVYSGNAIGIPVEIKNSNWVDSAGVVAQSYASDTALNKDSLAYMRGRDKVLAPNTGWIITATLPAQAAQTGRVFVLLEIEYSAVEGFNAEKLAGSPVFKKCANASVTAAVNAVTSIGMFDNLLQNVQYVLSEVSVLQPTGVVNPFFVVIEGFANQKGLTRIIPVKGAGLCDQIEGSVTLSKQTYNVEIISNDAITAAPVEIGFEFIASAN